jgi:hypothetical protein
MVVVKPAPRRHAAEVVVHHPLQSLHVSEHQGIHVLGLIVADLQLALKNPRDKPYEQTPVV